MSHNLCNVVPAAIKIHLRYMCGGYKRLNIINMTSLLVFYSSTHLKFFLLTFSAFSFIYFFFWKLKINISSTCVIIIHCLNISLTMRFLWLFLLDLVAHFMTVLFRMRYNLIGMRTCNFIMCCLFNSSSTHYLLFYSMTAVRTAS